MITEVKGNVFDYLLTHALAHCVSADFAMSSGVAGQVRRYFPSITSYLANYTLCEWGINILDEKSRQLMVGQSIRYEHDKSKGVVHNLITKTNVYENSEEHELPNEKSIRTALNHMADICNKLDQFDIVMPRIGCGLDRMKWKIVRPILDDIIVTYPFLNIIVCEFDPLFVKGIDPSSIAE